MKIRVNLTEDGIQKAIDEIKKYRNDFRLAYMRAVEDLCEVAAESCREAYGTSQITVEVVETATNYDAGRSRFEIRANGDPVGFLEFGAGLLAGKWNPLADNAPFPVYPGSYSEKNAQQYSRWGWWIFGGKTYEFIYPRRGLFVASETVKERLREVIRSSMHR